MIGVRIPLSLIDSFSYSVYVHTRTPGGRPGVSLESGTLPFRGPELLWPGSWRQSTMAHLIPAEFVAI